MNEEQATPRFPVGTTYTPLSGPRGRICTVVDYLVTRNLAGTIIRSRYVATHVFCGQIISEVDVPEATIARGNPVKPA